MPTGIPTSTHVLTTFTKRRMGLLFDDSSPSQRALWVRPAQDCSDFEVNELLSIRGSLLCVAISASRAQALALGPMSRPRMNPSVAPRSSENSDVNLSGMCESVEAREGVSTGISAHDRARTIAILGEVEPVARKLVKPGHIFPVAVREGGVLVRQALPEGALDVVRMAGFSDAAVFVDALNQSGELLCAEDQKALCESMEVPRISLSALTRMRLERETLIYKAAEARLPTRLAGEVQAIVYKSHIHEGEHVALIKGVINPDQPTIVRVQPEFTFGDVFGGNTPPSRQRLLSCLKFIGEHRSGVLVYLRRPLSGQLQSQIQSWKSAYQEKPAAMMREYGLGAQILRDLGVRKVNLLTGSTKNLVGLTSFGIEIVSQTAVPMYPNLTSYADDSEKLCGNEEQ